MYRPLSPALLRTGEHVDAAVIHAPDPQWAGPIEKLLLHKGHPWVWQNAALLRTETGVDARFYVLHRGNRPFSNLMLVIGGGVALLGHVWTEPDDRGRGASSWLLAQALAEFRAMKGQAIFLGTEYDAAPWHYYRRHGFEPVEPDSGYMAWYAASQAGFEREWFGAAAAVIEPLTWAHWPTAAPLFLEPAGGMARLVATPLFGRISSEGALLLLLQQLARSREPAGLPATACVLRDHDSPAVLGLVSRTPDPHWPETEILDLFCHQAWWHRAGELIASVPPTRRARTVAFCDDLQQEKRAVLESAGFRQLTIIPRWLPVSGRKGPPLDVAMLVRE